MNVRSKSGIKDNGPDIHFYHFRIPFKDLRPIDDQIPEPPSRGEEFTNDDAHQ